MGQKINSNEITPESVYLNRRNFLRLGMLSGSILATTGIYSYLNPSPRKITQANNIENVIKSEGSSASVEDVLTPNALEDITNYNNFYEFSTNKSAVAQKAEKFVTRPWTVEVGGLVQKPTVFGIEELLKYQQEERIYRFRCVEGWSMVIPWVGFPLNRILNAVEPLGKAQYVAFETFYGGSKSDNPQVKLPEGKNAMQNSFLAGIDFPYVEGLRLDEALHPLTILATGIYGKELPNQNGAPIRLVVPWKYGFKSIKSIVKITLTDQLPKTTWNIAAPSEYGFYSNVNPQVDHPRWTQATERKIGELSRRPTLLFNGYAEEVGKLYEGMDLKKYY